MSTTVTLEEAQAKLKELIGGLNPGDELVITDNARPVATVHATPPTPPPSGKRQLGTLRGTVLYMAPDFNAPLDDFKEYME